MSGISWAYTAMIDLHCAQTTCSKRAEKSLGHFFQCHVVLHKKTQARDSARARARTRANLARANLSR
jgi:hypothetical protein